MISERDESDMWWSWNFTETRTQLPTTFRLVNLRSQCWKIISLLLCPGHLQTPAGLFSVVLCCSLTPTVPPVLLCSLGGCQSNKSKVLFSTCHRGDWHSLKFKSIGDMHVCVCVCSILWEQRKFQSRNWQLLLVGRKRERRMHPRKAARHRKQERELNGSALRVVHKACAS